MMIKKNLLVVYCLLAVCLSASVAQKTYALKIYSSDGISVQAQPVQAESARVELSHEQSTQRALPLVLGLVGEPTASLKILGKKIAYDLGYSGQCDVSVRLFERIQKKDIMRALLKEGVLLAVFVTEQEKSAYEVRLYDTARATMLLGKRFSFSNDDMRVRAHMITDTLWPALTGQSGIFSTKIAYCKKVSGKKGAKIKQVYMCDYDGSNEERIVETSTVNVAPRWNRDMKHPLIYYSAYTNDNVRLEAVNMHKQRKIVSNFDGINMVPSFSSDGKSIVYCASRGKGSCQLFMVKDGKVRQLTYNTGNNISPSFSHDGNSIYFCSDYETGLPQICIYRLSDSTIERITKGGYCASPACSMSHDKVAYAKIIDGVMQIFMYDPVKKTHTQITFSAGNKEECSWSPCGTYLVYAHEEGSKGMIISLNMQTKRSRIITALRDACSYPSWSPVYAIMPSLKV